ncbi:hypothetical protein QLQ15_06870 [Lysobacter sp. LF1]|uniref:Uncharacterized protein n=1 Tax=Lysobacter stagni TaxID=3045172 RepID=A0ABT6XER4_9GAMM|nr:hypothetical protein [Lysobacter sp. LF1]MDI9238637.1 hypothetical protein [Lysobacter sp. LF1]
MLKILYMLLPPLAISAFAVGLLYFSALRKFGTTLNQYDPQLFARIGANGRTPISKAYAALEALRANPDMRAQLPPEVALKFKDVSRRLWFAAGWIMVLFAVSLAISVAKA